MTYKTLSVPLTETEWQALCAIAQCQYRNPKQQAAYFLRLALGLDDSNKHESAAEALASSHGTFVEPNR